MSELYVNQMLMDRVLDIKRRADDGKTVLEIVGLTDLWNKALNMTEDELVVCVCAALQVCPDKVFAAIAQDREEILRKGKRNERDQV